MRARESNFSVKRFLAYETLISARFVRERYENENIYRYTLHNPEPLDLEWLRALTNLFFCFLPNVLVYSCAVHIRKLILMCSSVYMVTHMSWQVFATTLVMPH